MSELTAEERHELVGILGKVNAAEIELREFHSKDALQRHELHKAT